MKYFEMFTGIGGFSKGIEQAYGYSNKHEPTQPEPSDGGSGRERVTDGGRADVLSANHTALCDRGGARMPECIGFSEIGKTANAILRYLYPNIRNYGDASRIICDELPPFDFLCAGFPCQSFSIAGKRGGFEDARGTLFFDIVRVLKAKRPMYALLENVKGLVSHDGGKTLEVILETLQEIGYFVDWEIYNSKDYGVPQNRERIFFICYSTDLIRDGHETMTKPCVAIIKQWMFQVLLNNWGAVIKRQGAASKDWVFGLCVLREMLSAFGHLANLNCLQQIWRNLFGNYVPYYQGDLIAQSQPSGLNWAESQSIRDGILTAMDENRFQTRTGNIWQNIDLLLSSVWEESYPDQKTFTTSTAIKRITETKTYTYSQMSLLISSATVHLRNSFAPLWKEVLSDLTLIQEGTNYARVHKVEKGSVVTESGRTHIVSVLESPDTHFIVGHIRGGSCGQVFSIGEGDGEAGQPGYVEPISGTISTKNQSGQCNFDGSTTLILGKDGKRKPTSIAATLTAGGHSGGNHSDMDLITVDTLRTHKNGEGFREMQSNVSPSLNARARQDGSQQPVIAIPVLTPDRPTKSQNGRRMKEDGEASFTVTAADRHGVMVATESMVVANAVTPDAYLTRGERNRDENGKSVLTSMAARRIRRLTPTECMRLQGFADDHCDFGINEKGEVYAISDTGKYQCAGNAVTVNVIEAITAKMIEAGCLEEVNER